MNRSYRDLLADLSSLVEAGVPLASALESLGSKPGTRSAPLARLLGRGVASGRTLAESLASAPQQVPAEHVALIAAGERSGQLPAALNRLVELLDRRHEAAMQALSRLLYPVFCLLAAALLLPLPLYLLQGPGTYWTVQVSLLLAVGLIFIVAWRGPRLLPANSAPRRVWERLLLGLPWMGSLSLERTTGRALWLLGRLIAAGITFDEALPLTADTVTFRTLSAEFYQVRRRLAQKQDISEAFAALRYFRESPDALVRLTVGEKAGVLDRTLDELGKHLEERYNRSIDRALRLAPAVVLFAVGVAVIIYVLKVFGGMYNV